MAELTLIAAIGRNNELGLNNTLIWQIPEDLRFFKEQTINKSILMGRNTFESLPSLLPNRTHLVLTSRTDLKESERLKVFNSLDVLIAYLEQAEGEIMVIGGSKIYETFLPYSNKMLLTEIDAENKADAFFPDFDKTEWTSEILSTSSYENLNYKHLVYRRNNQKNSSQK